MTAYTADGRRIVELDRVPVDFRLMGRTVPPIAGPGSEVWGVLQGWCHCGYCGYTGRVKAPTQAACPERHGWHRWLESCADDESWSLAWSHRALREHDSAAPERKQS